MEIITKKTEVAPEDVVKNNSKNRVQWYHIHLAMPMDIASMGVVDNGKSFDDFMNENGYSNVFNLNLEFHKGMTYDEVANILVHAKLVWGINI